MLDEKVQFNFRRCTHNQAQRAVCNTFYKLHSRAKKNLTVQKNMDSFRDVRKTHILFEDCGIPKPQLI